MDIHFIDIIIWTLIGGLIGWIAALLVTNGRPAVFAAAIAIGSLGAIIGGIVSANIVLSDAQGLAAPNFFIALLGALSFTSVLTFVAEKIDRNNN